MSSFNAVEKMKYLEDIERIVRDFLFCRITARKFIQDASKLVMRKFEGSARVPETSERSSNVEAVHTLMVDKK